MDSAKAVHNKHTSSNINYMEQGEQHNYDENEFDEPEKDTSERDQGMLDNRIEEKKNYLNHLKLAAKQMSKQIKTINEDLDKKMNKLLQKQLVKKKDKQQRGPVDPELEKKLNEKYKELDSIRTQIKKLKAREFNVQFAVDRVKDLQAELRLETQEVDKLSKVLESLTKANSSRQPDSGANFLIPSYTEQISRLKTKIKQITGQRQIQTQQLINIGRKNRTQKSLQMPSIDRSKSTPKGYLIDDQSSPTDQLSVSVAEAKRKYEQVGRRLEIMKVRRNILLQEDGHLQDRIRLLHSYKLKYDELKKVQQGKKKHINNSSKILKDEEPERQIKQYPIEQNIYSSVNGQPAEVPKLSNQQYMNQFKKNTDFMMQEELPDDYT